MILSGAGCCLCGFLHVICAPEARRAYGEPRRARERSPANPVWVECRALRFDDRPDCSYLRKSLRDLFVREGYQYDYVFDWRVQRPSGADDKSSRRKRARLGGSNTGCAARARVLWRTNVAKVAVDDLCASTTLHRSHTLPLRQSLVSSRHTSGSLAFLFTADALVLLFHFTIPRALCLVLSPWDSTAG